jgi:zinc transport system substrate-binding protein
VTRLGVVLAGLAFLVAGCERAAPPGRPVVIASVYPLYAFAREVAGDRAAVSALVPPGAEPHDWEPSPQSVVEIRKARVFVYNGAGLEPWVDRVLPEVGARGTVVVNATRNLPLTSAGGAPDPHVWLDPVLAAGQVEAIRAALAQADPAGAAAYAEHARAFQERLAALDRAFAAGLAHCARRDVVTSHAAFAYLTRRYGLVQVAVMGLAPETEPSPADLAAIARLARQRRVEYVFFETLVSSRLAEALAREVGARTLVLNPIEGLTREEAAAGKGYVDLMEANLQNLRTGLGCR